MLTEGAERLQEPDDVLQEADHGPTLAVQALPAAPGELTSPPELLEAAQEFARAAKSPATRRAYASDLRDFDAERRWHVLREGPLSREAVREMLQPLS